MTGLIGIVVFGLATMFGLITIGQRRRTIREFGYDPKPNGRSIGQLQGATLLFGILFVFSLLLRLLLTGT